MLKRSRWALSIGALVLLGIAPDLGAAAPGPQEQDKPPVQAEDPPETLDPNASCTTKCHTKLVSRPFTHDPLLKGNCKVCHPQPAKDKHEFGEVDDLNETCISCHEMELDEVVHEPVEESECIVCHDSHGSQVKSMLTRTGANLCAVCHKDQMVALNKATRHPSIEMEDCLRCHAAHSSPAPKLLAQDRVTTCLRCHQDHAEQRWAANHIHEPATAGCGDCHNIHGTDQRYLLKAAVPKLCLQCHENIDAELSNAAIRHGALDNERSCLNCHQPHVSRSDRLLDGTVREACVTCHDRQQSRPDRPPVQAIALDLINARFLHGPIREDNCVACHKTHGGVASLLRREYPSHFYAHKEEHTYDLCFGCHDRSAFETPRTLVLTRFRDGDRNLHQVHVNQEKSRTCRACHEIHGSQSPALIAETVPFGRWSMPIEHRRTPTGGSCAPGCHEEQSYRHAPLTPKPSGAAPRH